MKRGWLLASAVLAFACSKGSLEPMSGDETASPPSVPSVSMPAPEASSSGGARDDVDAGPVADAESSMQSATCIDGTREVEPNDATAKASALVVGKNCGAVGPGDADFFVLALEGSCTLHFDAPSEDVRFFLVDRDGGGAIEVFAGDELNVDGTSAKTFFRVESRSKQTYTIRRQ